MHVPDNSVILIDKPLHWSSFDVIRYLKKEYRQHTSSEEVKLPKLKIGHAGTLDPLATGLLVICTGKLTKQIDNYQGQTKEYLATVILGATTQSDDREYPPQNISSTADLKELQFKDVLEEFVGEITQTPPMFSALKINGQRAYKIARQNAEQSNQDQEKNTIVAPEPKLKERVISIYSIEYIANSWERIKVEPSVIEFSQFQILIRCSKGTYIRSLARDIGARLGCGAYLGGLRRTKIGDLDVQNAYQIDDPNFIPSTKR